MLCSLNEGQYTMICSFGTLNMLQFVHYCHAPSVFICISVLIKSLYLLSHGVFKCPGNLPFYGFWNLYSILICISIVNSDWILEEI